mgnify:CR=1 FL=1
MKLHGRPGGIRKEGSPPARGAWIEIPPVALTPITSLGRPPRGGRGLKSYIIVRLDQGGVVAPREGGVD